MLVICGRRNFDWGRVRALVNWDIKIADDGENTRRIESSHSRCV